MSTDLDLLCHPAPSNLPTCHTFTSWRQQWSLKWPLLFSCRPPSFVPLLSTSRLVSASHLTCSCTKHLAPLLSPSLHVFASSISGHSHSRSLSITRTHTHTVGLRFQGSYDTIQIVLAAYSREMCFVLSHFPQKSRFSLPSSFDPHGMGGLCQQSCVSAGGPGRPPQCHSLLSVFAGAAKPPCGAVSRRTLKSTSHETANIMTTQNCTSAHTFTHKRFYGVWLEVWQI